MRVQTRLVLGTAALVLALMAVQWWLHVRQVAAIDGGFSAVATSVGEGILTDNFQFFVHHFESKPEGKGSDVVWVTQDDPATERVDADVRVLRVPDGSDRKIAQRIERVVRLDEGDVATEELVEGQVLEMALENCEDVETTHEVRVEQTIDIDDFGARQVRMTVVADEEAAERFLVVSADGTGERRIPIPVSPYYHSVRDTLRRGMAMSSGLLVVGLVASGLLANRLTRPLRSLADGAEALGRGELGSQVPVTSTGEIGELQRAFNRMSMRLQLLEAEREAWREREHLAQLGDLSRGLAHTLRNPLHTLGLAVEELADGGDSDRALVTTARSQIRRIDHWLRSFLALGAGDAAETVEEDLADLVRGVALESVQGGADLKLEIHDDPLPVRVVPTAVRAALANLVENAVDATADVVAVEISVAADGDQAVVTVADRGAGLPADVRERLFEPHVTTKAGGSGMGLYLARQLIVGMHAGALDVTDRPGGGTLAEVRIPLTSRDGSSG